MKDTHVLLEVLCVLVRVLVVGDFAVAVALVVLTTCCVVVGGFVVSFSFLPPPHIQQFSLTGVCAQYALPKLLQE